MSNHEGYGQWTSEVFPVEGQTKNGAGVGNHTLFFFFLNLCASTSEESNLDMHPYSSPT
jgi:hypothetical protein